MPQLDKYLKFRGHLQLHNVSVGKYLTDRYALWLDFRTIDENELHRTGRRTENASEGITQRKAETDGALNAYIYLIMDAQLRMEAEHRSLVEKSLLEEINELNMQEQEFNCLLAVLFYVLL